MSWFFDSRRHALAAKGIKTARAIPQLNVAEYMGKWYQIKAFPIWFQKGCSNVVAEYTQKNDYIEVKNSCKVDGKTKVAKAKAYPANKGKSKLKIDFVGGRIFTGDYWVLYTDYDTALVGTPDKKSLWILARKKTLPQDKIAKLEKIAKSQGFDVTKLMRQ